MTFSSTKDPNHLDATDILSIRNTWNDTLFYYFQEKKDVGYGDEESSGCEYVQSTYKSAKRELAMLVHQKVQRYASQGDTIIHLSLTD